jgi:hypothetical protein
MLLLTVVELKLGNGMSHNLMLGDQLSSLMGPWHFMSTTPQGTSTHQHSIGNINVAAALLPLPLPLRFLSAGAFKQMPLSHSLLKGQGQ